MYLHQELTHEIIAAAIEVHKIMGPGLLEAVYRICLSLELTDRGVKHQKEVAIPLLYKKQKIDHCFRLDFLVENEVVVELKSLETVLPLHEAQLLTYLRLSRKQVGLLINFNMPILKTGIRRLVLSETKSYQSCDSKVSDFISAEMKP